MFTGTMVKAVRQSYDCLAQGRINPFLGPGGADKEMKAAQGTCGLDTLLAIEGRTMKEAWGPGPEAGRARPL